MIRVFIGYDTREVVAWHVLAHSILSRCSEPVSITPVGNSVTHRPYWWREKGAHDSTEFSNARFIVPALTGYEGHAIFMDCDMICLGDLADLWRQRDDSLALKVVKHDHRPKEHKKFLGAEQSAYPFKNWSSLMLINCEHPNVRSLVPEYVNDAPGLDLHGFAWTPQDTIGDIEGLWNVLTIGHGAKDLLHPEGVSPGRDIKLLHYTRGGPWHGIRDTLHHLWDREFYAMMAHGNPCATHWSPALNTFSVSYRP